MNHLTESTKQVKGKLQLILPMAGMVAFVSLYLLASLQYPGGSQANPTSKGFSWMNNYFCNLLNATAINGQPNQGQGFAIASLLVLALSMIQFFWSFPNFVQTSRVQSRVIRMAGLGSMSIACLLFTNLNHDLITNGSSVAGLVAILVCMWVLFQNKLYQVLVFGCFNLTLVLLNNWLYYHPALIKYLPVVQKISFASFLIWVCSINLRWYFALGKEKK